VRPAVEAEKLGIPSVVIATSGFTQLARALGKSTGIANLRIAEYPGPMGIDTPVQMRDKLEQRVFDAGRMPISSSGARSVYARKSSTRSRVGAKTGRPSVHSWAAK
jgi:hypothetical protein